MADCPDTFPEECEQILDQERMYLIFQTALCSAVFLALTVFFFKIICAPPLGKVAYSNAFTVIAVYIVLMLALLLVLMINGALTLADVTILETPMSFTVLYEGQL